MMSLDQIHSQHTQATNVCPQTTQSYWRAGQPVLTDPVLPAEGQLVSWPGNNSYNNTQETGESPL